MAKLFTPNDPAWVDEELVEAPLHKVLDGEGDPIPGNVTNLTETMAAVNTLLVALAAGAKIELATEVTVAGTSLTAACMNNIEEGLDAVDDAVNVEGHDAKTTPIDADEVNLWDSVVSAWKSLSWANIKATLLTYFYTIFPNQNGWMPVADTWTYAAAIMVTVPSGAYSKYSRFSKFKFDQHGVTKQGYLDTASDTALTLYFEQGKVVENTSTYPITNIYFSNAARPLGFPSSILHSPTYSPQSGTFTSVRHLDTYWWITEGVLNLTYSFDGALSDAATYIDMPLPISVVLTQLSFPCLICTGAPGKANLFSASVLRLSPISGAFSAASYQGASGSIQIRLY